MSHSSVHIHQMKRKGLHPHPSPDPRIAFLDRLVLVVAVVLPLMALPQAYNIWIKGLTEGVSLLTWSMLGLLTIPMLVYSIVHKDKVFIVFNGLWLVVDLMIILGLLVIG